MKTKMALLIVTLAAASIALAVDKPVDLSGTWTLEKSEQSFSSPTVAPGGADAGGFPGGGGSQGGSGGSFPGSGGGGFPGGGGGRRGGASFPRTGGQGDGSAGPASLAVPQELTLIIAQTPTEIKIERRWRRDGRQQSVTRSFALDGSESTNPSDTGNGELKSKTKWKKSTLIIEGDQRAGTGNRDMDIHVKQEFTLSKDGTQMTVKMTRANMRGVWLLKQTFRKS